MTKQEAIDKLPQIPEMYKDDIKLLQENLELLSNLHQGLEEIVKVIIK